MGCRRIFSDCCRSCRGFLGSVVAMITEDWPWRPGGLAKSDVLVGGGEGMFVECTSGLKVA